MIVQPNSNQKSYTIFFAIRSMEMCFLTHVDGRLSTHGNSNLYVIDIPTKLAIFPKYVSCDNIWSNFNTTIHLNNMCIIYIYICIYFPPMKLELVYVSVGVHFWVLKHPYLKMWSTMIPFMFFCTSKTSLSKACSISRLIALWGPLQNKDTLLPV